jgi:hypothetical protein
MSPEKKRIMGSCAGSVQQTAPLITYAMKTGMNAAKIVIFRFWDVRGPEGSEPFFYIPHVPKHTLMDTAMRDRFVTLWEQFCPGAELPVTFEIGDVSPMGERAKITGNWQCLICDLARVRKGITLVLDRSSVTCAGGLYFLGYDPNRSENFRYFLSAGKPGVVEGERYKRTPEIVDQWSANHDVLPAEGKCYTFKRWDKMTPVDNPEGVIFFARPEILSALFTLANFDQADPNGVICPMGSGCSTIIHYPRLEQQSEHPRAVLGMFDPSARPCVPVDVLTFAIPMRKFKMMIGYMEQSFLITKAWGKVQGKIKLSKEKWEG